MTRALDAALKILLPSTKKPKPPRSQNERHMPQRRQSEIPKSSHPIAQKRQRALSVPSM